ncbi:MAG: isoprenylcysteine carboxylmethyltransferase family protein [Anaerolineales bacterium]|nr:isoprenylcysteine carboxylmethyltransferase family protein [Anaerolineales bacterium]
MDFFDCILLIGIAVYIALTIGRTIHLRITQGVRPFVLGAGKSGLPAALEICFFLWLLIWLAETILAALQAPFRIFPPPLDRMVIDSAPWKLLGAALLPASIALFAWALVSFGSDWRVGMDTQTPGKLATGGIFAISRNPIYLSLDLFFLGTFLILGTLFFLAAAILVALGMHYQILQEEKHLEKIYGVEYRSYRKATARYIGCRSAVKKYLSKRPSNV